MTTLIVAAFAVGAVAGFSLPHSASGASHADAALNGSASTFRGVAANNMSDARYQALYRPSVGVADDNMSDARNQALYGPSTGVAANNMSDARNQALYGPSAGDR